MISFDVLFYSSDFRCESSWDFMCEFSCHFSHKYEILTSYANHIGWILGQDLNYAAPWRANTLNKFFYFLLGVGGVMWLIERPLAGKQLLLCICLV